jgi:hypothetical protein
VFRDLRYPELDPLALEAVRPHTMAWVRGVSASLPATSVVNRLQMRESTSKGTTAAANKQGGWCAYSESEEFTLSERGPVDPPPIRGSWIDGYEKAFMAVDDSAQAMKVISKMT